MFLSYKGAYRILKWNNAKLKFWKFYLFQWILVPYIKYHNNPYQHISKYHFFIFQPALLFIKTFSPREGMSEMILSSLRSGQMERRGSVFKIFLKDNKKKKYIIKLHNCVIFYLYLGYQCCVRKIWIPSPGHRPPHSWKNDTVAGNYN